jgi:hypothetical protein
MLIDGHLINLPFIVLLPIFPVLEIGIFSILFSWFFCFFSTSSFAKFINKFVSQDNSKLNRFIFCYFLNSLYLTFISKFWYLFKIKLYKTSKNFWNFYERIYCGLNKVIEIYISFSFTLKFYLSFFSCHIALSIL